MKALKVYLQGDVILTIEGPGDPLKDVEKSINAYYGERTTSPLVNLNTTNEGSVVFSVLAFISMRYINE